MDDITICHGGTLNSTRIVPEIAAVEGVQIMHPQATIMFLDHQVVRANVGV